MVEYVKYLEDIPMFEIELTYLRALAEDKGLEITDASPLNLVKPAYVTKYEGASEDKLLLSLTEILCKPFMVSHFSKAGIGEMTETFTVYGGKSHGKMYFTFIQTHDSERRMLLFDTVEEIATYIVSRYGAMNTRSFDGVDSFTTDMNHFIFLLNIIDSVRRRYLSSLLNGKNIAVEHISLETYQSELDFNLKNSDVRWLLPSALRLIPKVHQFKMAFDPREFQFEMPHQLVTLYQGDDQSEVMFFLSDAIKKLSLTFTHHWKYAIGFDVQNLIQPEMLMKRFYLAPTNEANHLFEIDEPLEAGICHYEALSFDVLLSKIEDIFILAMQEC